jgi:AcrR family transcriptional regulator
MTAVAASLGDVGATAPGSRGGYGVREADTASLRERKKDQTRRALAERAFELAQERGFGGFTISELVADVGVSRRTFSNYFASKAECLAAVLDGWLDDVLEAIRQAPRDASLVQVMHAGLTAVATQGVQRWGALQMLAASEPGLAACMLADDEMVVDQVAAAISARSGPDSSDIRVRLLASFAITAGREVLCRWTALGDAADNAALGRLLSDAFSILNPDALAGPPRG